MFLVFNFILEGTCVIFLYFQKDQENKINDKKIKLMKSIDDINLWWTANIRDPNQIKKSLNIDQK